MVEIFAPGQARVDRRNSARSTPDRRAAERPKLGNFQFTDSATLISPRVIVGAIRILEFFLIAILGYGIYLGYVVGAPTSPLDSFHLLYLAASFGMATTAVLTFQAFQLYDVLNLTSLLRQSARLVIAWSLLFAALFSVLFLAKLGDEFSRVWATAWYGLGLTLLLAARAGINAAILRWANEGRLHRRAVIVGGGDAADNLIGALEASTETDIQIYGVFDDRTGERSADRIAGYPKLGNIDQLLEFGRKMRLDLLILSLPITAESRLLELYKKLWVLPVDIRLSAHSNQLRFRPRSYSYIGNVPFFDVQDKPIADWDYVLKWLFDKIVATCALIALAPVMLLVGLAVKIDSPGPVFFKQKRHGFNNELIEVFKFRSMYADQSDSNASKLVTKDDDRVTRVGRFIRKTSLDELPQLFNVMKGELSLVGPRPHALKAKAANKLYADVVDGYFARHRVKPGITGWAQINGWRGETNTLEKLERRVEHDLYYIENWSVLFDIMILAKTPIALLKTENAF